MKALFRFDYEKIAFKMLREHGLNDWIFCTDKAKSRLGQCRYASKQIAISEHILDELSHEEIMDTIIHEIAHALTEGDGHGKIWKQKCLELGCRPMAKYIHDYSIYKANDEHKFDGVCPTCKRVHIKTKPVGLCNSCYHESYITKKKIDSHLIFEKL